MLIGKNENHFITGIQILIFSMIMIFPAAALSADEYVFCDGKYKDGGRPSEAELKRILSDHEVWLKSENREKNDIKRANLCEADLSKAYLYKANLSWANLAKADLSGANLSGAKLSGADLSEDNLSGADLSKADLSKADLSEADLSEANLSGAKLTEAKLFWANLSEAYLAKADLFGAYLYKADLSWANLSEANLSGADLSWANLSGAKLTGAKLSGANLSEADLSEANLTEAKLSRTNFTKVNLKEAIYGSTSSPDKELVTEIQNLKTVTFNKGNHSGLVLLRNSLKEVGLRELEREATYALEKGKTRHLSPSPGKYSRLVFFEWTAGYGLYPGRCLIILLCLIPIFALIYFFPVFRKKVRPPYNYLSEISFSTKVLPYPSLLRKHKSGIYRIWSEGRIRKDLGSSEPELVIAGFVKGIGYALYFSILSAFHIGWRDINVGSWITRIQPREYTLQATGWVRAVSGIQSLLSIYLLAFWVLTQFGRPFD